MPGGPPDSHAKSAYLASLSGNEPAAFIPAQARFPSEAGTEAAAVGAAGHRPEPARRRGATWGDRSSSRPDHGARLLYLLSDTPR